ncbi:MAG TPA: ABC transporter permease [Vicinamibacterales bacterium]
MIAGAIYRCLVRAHPRAFRERFGAPMTQAFRDGYAHAVLAGRGGKFALRACADALANLVILRAASVRDRVFWPDPLTASNGPSRRSPMWWQSLLTDARYAWRMAVRNPVFTALAVAALALGIGANTAIFTIVNGVLLKPLPYAHPDELVMVWSSNAVEHRSQDTVAPLDFLDYQQASAFSSMHAGYSFLVPAPLTTNTGTEQVVISVVTPGTFEMLGRAPILGRPFTQADVKSAVVISHAFWISHFGGDPQVLGRVMNLAFQPRTIVGVMPPDFAFPYRTMLGPSGFTRAHAADMWLPLEFVAEDSRQTGVATLMRGVRFLIAVGRLKPGVTVDQANAEISGIAQRLAQEHPDTNRNVGASVVPVHEQAVGSVRSALLVLLGGVGVVLLMACVNLANMMLARSTARQKEMAIRAALGAGRGRLIRQALVESVLLSLAGGLVAVVVVRFAMHALIALAPAESPRIDEVRPDFAMMVFTFALALATGILVGLVPAFAAARPHVHSTMKEFSRGSTSGRSQRRARAALVVVEVALAVVLTIGAGLLLRSFTSLLAVNPGFTADGLLTLQITVPQKYASPGQRRTFYADLIGRLSSLPGVTDVGGTTRLPLGSTNVSTKLVIEGRNLPRADWPEAEFRRSVHSYFSAMRIPILRGRGFDATDGPDSPSVAVVNQTLAQQIFGSEDPIGKRVKFGSDEGNWTTIVGVIGDVRHSGLEAKPAPEVYVNYLQNPPFNPFLVLRTAGDPSALIPAVRAQIQSLDKDLAAYDIRPMSTVRAESVAQRRFVLLLVAAFGVLALVMAAVGVYGVMALVVSERTTEMGIRLALGARPSDVLSTIVRQGLVLAAAGIAIGVGAALLAAPLLASQLYAIRAADPITLLAVPALLLTVAAIACYVPARRAMRIDPAGALRAE